MFFILVVYNLYILHTNIISIYFENPWKSYSVRFLVLNGWFVLGFHLLVMRSTRSFCKRTWFAVFLIYLISILVVSRTYCFPDDARIIILLLLQAYQRRLRIGRGAARTRTRDGACPCTGDLRDQTRVVIDNRVGHG